MKKNVEIAIMVVLAGILAAHMASASSFAAAKDYTVSTKTKPIVRSYESFSTYNKDTKDYYMLRSYLEKIEKNGGGKLTLKKGKYSISNTLYVPSNATIQLSDGV